MSILSSKQAKQQSLVDMLFVCLALTLVIFILVPSNWKMYNHSPIRLAPGILKSTPADLTLQGNVSFTADQKYWDANCIHGWSSDPGCDAIVLKAQSCTENVMSAYCSQYQNYLQEHRKK